MTHRNKVRPPVRRLTEEDARKGLSFGLLRLTSDHGPSRVGLEAGCDEKTIRNARDQKSTLRIDLALNLLALDPTALDELLGSIGFKLVPVSAAAANDLHTAAGLLDGASELIRAQEDGIRDPSETMRVAEKLRPHLPAAIAIVREADELRGAA
ncbi:MAG: hypothetical protein ABW043_16980 [Devosia sp.]|uniref:hypothetical protein n=1 Tax=Devosia sp. TaxID=1871048 RepID=UPI0033921FD2